MVQTRFVQVKGYKKDGYTVPSHSVRAHTRKSPVATPKKKPAPAPQPTTRPKAVKAKLGKAYSRGVSGNRFQIVYVTDSRGVTHREDIMIRQGRNGLIESGTWAKQQALKRY